MLYYLDTNIIYNLKHLPAEIKKSSYTSFLVILEVVAGINERNYAKRRSALKSIIDLQLPVDWRNPDMVIFDSFNAYSDFSMSVSHVADLANTMLTCVSTDTYSDFIKLQVNNISAVEFFKNIDNRITNKFSSSFPELIPAIKKSTLVCQFTLGDMSVNVDFTEAIKAAFINEGKHAMLVKHLAVGCHYLISNSKAPDKPEHQLPEVMLTYNGGADFFICAWLAYELKNIGVANLPGRNDYQDLLHFLYLRNHLDRKIVSDDGIYMQLVPQYCCTLHSFSENSNTTN